MKCSFCGRRDSEVEKLVAGPKKLVGRVYICDRCATQAVQIMETHGVDPSATSRGVRL
jgi:ATP-dependent protease Clp ATPase subunit